MPTVPVGEAELEVPEPIASGRGRSAPRVWRGREIEILRFLPEQGVADATSDEPDPIAGLAVEAGEVVQFRRDRELHRFRPPAAEIDSRARSVTGEAWPDNVALIAAIIASVMPVTGKRLQDEIVGQ